MNCWLISSIVLSFSLLLDFAWESESVFWVNDTYYIAFNHENAAHLYKMKITKKVAS